MNVLVNENNLQVQTHKELLIRAHTYRQSVKSSDSGDDHVSLISFVLLNEIYGIELNSLQEILKAKSISKVPGSSEFLHGVINLRGSLITVVDLKQRLGLDGVNMTEDSRVMIVHHEERSIGLLVDKVLEIVKLPQKNISNPSSGLMESEMRFIKKIGKTVDHVITIPDLKEIFQSLI